MDQETIIKLIELYKERRVLWDYTYEDYADRAKKNESWEELSSIFEMDRSDVHLKIRRLIGQFQRELKKERTEMGPYGPYKSKWIFFKYLLFLKDRENERQIRKEKSDQILANGNGTQSQESVNSFVEASHLFSSENVGQSCTVLPVMDEKFERNLIKMELPLDMVSWESQSSSSSLSPKRKTDDEKAEAYSVKRRTSGNSHERDEFDVFGEYVALSLRNLKCRTTQSYAKFDISNVLHRAEMKLQKNETDDFSNSDCIITIPRCDTLTQSHEPS